MGQIQLQISRNQGKYNIKFIGDHLTTAQDAGLEFWQTHCYVPVGAKGMRRKNCQRKWEERIVRKTADTENDQK